MDSFSETIEVIILSGPRLAITEVDLIKYMISHHVASGSIRLVLDFTTIEFIDSSMIGVLIGGIKRVRPMQGDIKLCCLQPQIHQTFRSMNLNEVFDIHTDVESARRAFV